MTSRPPQDLDGHGEPDDSGDFADIERETIEMRKLLDELATEEQHDLRSAAGAELEHAPGEQLVEQTLARLWGASADDAAGAASTTPRVQPRASEATHRPAAGRGWLALAALLVLALAVWQYWPAAPQPSEPVQLGADAPRLLQPLGIVPEYGELRWEHPAPGGLEFEVSVFDATSSATDGALVAGPVRIDGTRWLDPRGTSGWPDAVRIELTPFDRNGQGLDSASVVVRRAR
jgi:hypothetical protein